MYMYVLTFFKDEMDYLAKVVRFGHLHTGKCIFDAVKYFKYLKPLAAH